MPQINVEDAIPICVGERTLDASISFRLPQLEYDDLEAEAEKEGRSLSNHIRMLFKEGRDKKEADLAKSRAVNPWGRQLADGMPIRVWLAGRYAIWAYDVPVGLGRSRGLRQEGLPAG